MDALEFGRAISRARRADERLAWFGALLRKEAGRDVEIVGGSAIEIYLSSDAYVSQDVDLVGSRSRIEDALRRWRFTTVTGRSHRLYWTHRSVGLVDIVGAADRSGLSPRRMRTPYGELLLSAPEPLVIRRLVRAEREAERELFRQAVELARLGDLDWEYLESEAGYEKVEAGLRRLRKVVSGLSSGTARRPSLVKPNSGA